jgi:hypothetical protein
MPQAEPKIASSEKDLRWLTACCDAHAHGYDAAEDAQHLNDGAVVPQEKATPDTVAILIFKSKTL